MAALANLLNSQFKTSFGNNTNVTNYLIGQTTFSTTLGFVVCRLPFFQSLALGLATEGCRYATDKAIEQLPKQFKLIKDYKTAVKTALVAGSFYLAQIAINKALPGPTNLLEAGLLMATTYLVAEPIVNAYTLCTKQIIKKCFNDIKNQYPAVGEKITQLFNLFKKQSE